jgi:tetratricopeptide (TPR) repeat protein
MAVAVVAVALGVPALAFVLWPLFRPEGRGRALMPLPPDEREHLLERKRQALRALRELAFERDAGHVSDDDYADLRARYEAEAAAVLAELDRLGARPEPARAGAPPPAGTTRAGWRHPLALGASAVLLVLFGVALGAGIVRHTAPDPMAGAPAPGSRPLADIGPAGTPPPPGAQDGAARPVTPEMMAGMLQAARSALLAGRYGEAISAYQAILKRDPRNVDALTHLGLIVAIGGHADSALETFDRALAIDPDYAPALLYRGQVLYEAKRDTAGAIKAWERFLRVAPPGEDRERVQRLIAEARARK